MLLLAVGGGLDLARAFYARQKLSEVATLTCQFSIKPTAVEAGATAAYVSSVNGFALSSLGGQGWGANLPTDSQGTMSAYFRSTAATGASGSQVPTGTTELFYNVPTSFMSMFHVKQIPVHAIVPCQPAAAATTGPVGTVLISEGFETGVSGYYFISQSGAIGTTATPSQGFPSTAGYQGDGGSSWYITGYCLEVDQVGVINSTDPQGSHSAELDCDNGSGSAGNSSISTKKYLNAGYYELRYNYRSRTLSQNYYPAYVCGSIASDVSWANDVDFGGASRDNQLNVYLDQDVTGSAPLHTTIDGTQKLAGANMVDLCVFSFSWVERSVKIHITTAGNYWLSFAADGANSSYGAQLDNIRLCVDSCAGTPQDNFPWTANQVLFEDTFDTPSYTANGSQAWLATNGNPANSVGQTITSICANAFGTYPAVQGWACQAASGWGTGPLNQVNYFLQGADQGSQYITLDGTSSGSTTTNRAVSRPFLLDPGYYQVSYDYISNINFASGFNFCTAAPASGVIYPATLPNSSGTARFHASAGSYSGTTDILGVFMSHGQLISTPNIAQAPWAVSSNTTYSAPALSAQATYTNPDGTVTATPATPPDKVNWALYDSTAVNPVLDTCGYSDAWKWQPRTVAVKITKPGVYWLTFSANGGAADGDGPGIDDVKLTALGSPYMSSPPTTAVTAIPVPSPQPDSNYSNNGAYTGFYIVADPFKPTAADQ